MNYLEEFEEEEAAFTFDKRSYTWKDYLFAIIIAPIAIPIILLKRLSGY